MESEKVKVIKKGLECCTNPVYCEKECPYHIYERHLECINELAKDSLTLINELENENERLSSRYRNLEINYNDTWEHYREYEVENQKLKDRIDELKKENAKLLDSVETVQSNRCVYKCVLTKEQLKQFAERLKEKMGHYDNGWHIERNIEETLKEFINETNE